MLECCCTAGRTRALSFLPEHLSVTIVLRLPTHFLLCPGDASEKMPPQRPMVVPGAHLSWLGASPLGWGGSVASDRFFLEVQVSSACDKHSSHRCAGVKGSSPSGMKIGLSPPL